MDRRNFLKILGVSSLLPIATKVEKEIAEDEKKILISEDKFANNVMETHGNGITYNETTHTDSFSISVLPRNSIKLEDK